MGLSAPAADKLAASEVKATWIRLALVVFAGAAYLLLLDPADTRPSLAYATLAAAGAYSLTALLLEPYREAPFVTGLAMSVTDLGLVSAWIVATGGFASPFYLMLYLSLTALAFRYGPREAAGGAVVYAGVYLAILAVEGTLAPNPVAATVRAGFLFMFAAFGSVFSRAMHDQTVAKHEYHDLAEDLEHALSLQRATLDATADGVLVTDLEGNLTTFNERFRRMWGLPEGLMEQDDDLALQCVMPDLEDPERFVDRLEEIYADPEATAFDVVPFRDGRILERYTCPQRLDGEVVGRVFSFRDVTERFRSREQLKSYARELEHRNEDLKQFAHVVSHDLQEPLRVISNFLDLLEERHGEEMVPEALEFVRIAARSADRMEDLIEDLLAYARVDTRADDPEPVDAGLALDEARANLELKIQDAGAVVDAAELPVVEADRSQLVLVFQNLLQNALKYGGDHPRIQVRVRPHEEGFVFAVADDGPGIPEDERDDVFTVFNRLSRHNDRDGTGMGLAICKRVVERHGGRIWIDDADDGLVDVDGATFKFTLPGTPGDPGQRSSASVRPSATA